MNLHRRWLEAPPRARDGLAIAGLALVARAAVVAWAAPRFPPVEDGHFYHVVATRIASGLGYTWAWPDGAVTYAAHYPVGYPALVGGGYALVAPVPLVAMATNALFGALAVLAVHVLASTVASRAGAAGAALAIAFHPGLLLYTPALMTEGVTCALLVMAAALAVESPALPPTRSPPFSRLALSGAILGAAVLMRPQIALLVPALAFLRTGPRLRQFAAATVLVASSAAVCVAPWVLRNCARMNACVVSANGGWNLYIGAAPGASGSFTPLAELGVPEECRTVWDEAEKDACFGRAARRAIAEAPLSFAGLAPRKLAATFDYAGAAGWYLHASNPAAFGERAKIALGAIETVWQRALVLAALVGIGWAGGPRARARRWGAAVAGLTLLTPAAWIAHLGLVVVAALLGPGALHRHPPALFAAAVVLATAASHAVFFGAGRYSLVAFPAIAAAAALASLVLTRPEPARDTGG